MTRLRAEGSGEYVDDGCSLAPHCLTCPLPVCRYDLTDGHVSVRNIRRDHLIIAANAAGESVNTIAEAAGISRRSVFRVLATA